MVVKIGHWNKGSNDNWSCWNEIREMSGEMHWDGP